MRDLCTIGYHPYLSPIGWKTLLPYLGLVEYTPVGIIITSRACLDYRSSFGQRVEKSWGCVILTFGKSGISPKLDYDASVLPNGS